jgi:hypothetical protein
MTADVNELAGRKKPASRRTGGDALVEHPRREQRDEDADNDDQLLDVRAAR